jgi:hypothetical protein
MSTIFKLDTGSETLDSDMIEFTDNEGVSDLLTGREHSLLIKSLIKVLFQ